MNLRQHAGNSSLGEDCIQAGMVLENALRSVDRDFRLTQELMKAWRKETGRQERGTNRYAHQARMTAICLLGITIEGVNHVGS